MKVRDVIANVPDFWTDHKHTDSLLIGEFNADRIIKALNDAGYHISKKEHVSDKVDSSRCLRTSPLRHPSFETLQDHKEYQ